MFAVAQKAAGYEWDELEPETGPPVFAALAERAIGQTSCGWGTESQERGTLPLLCPGLSKVFFFVLFDGLDTIRRGLWTQPMESHAKKLVFILQAAERQLRWKVPCIESQCPRETRPLVKHRQVTG